MKLFLLTFLISWTSFAHEAHHHHDDMDKGAGSSLKGESVYNLNSTWSDQNEAKHKLSDFKGKPVLLAMVYTSCKSACPMTVSQLQQIEQKLSEKAKSRLQIILVSFDSDRDTPKKLLEFANSRKLDLQRWRLLTSSESSVRELANVLGIKFRREKDGEYSHSNILTVLDSQGVIRQQKIGLETDSQQIISTLQKLE